MQLDYVDDGIAMMDYRLIELVTDECEKLYKPHGLRLKKEKTDIIVNTDDKDICDHVKRLASKYNCEYNFQGKFVFLGVPYGPKDYVNAFMDKRIKSIFKKVDHIKLINSSFVKHNLLRKLYDYNKIIYALKVIDKYDEWIDELIKLHLVISKVVSVGVSATKTTKFQISISQKRGGLGLRNPNEYKWAAELSAIEGKKEIIGQYFTFMDLGVAWLFNIYTKVSLDDWPQKMYTGYSP